MTISPTSATGSTIAPQPDHKAQAKANVAAMRRALADAFDFSNHRRAQAAGQEVVPFPVTVVALFGEVAFVPTNAIAEALDVALVPVRLLSHGGQAAYHAAAAGIAKMF